MGKIESLIPETENGPIVRAPDDKMKEWDIDGIVIGRGKQKEPVKKKSVLVSLCPPEM
jgi:hypothetical protein